MELIDALRQLRAGDIPIPLLGLCENLEFLCPTLDGHDFVARHAPSWPEFSGRACYPVPDPDGECPPDGLFHSRQPKWTGPYGEARMRLVDHLIESIKS